MHDMVCNEPVHVAEFVRIQQLRVAVELNSHEFSYKARRAPVVERWRLGMARTWSLVLVLLATVALAPAAPALKDRQPKDTPIFGEWYRVGHTEAGTPVPPDREAHHQVFTSDGQWEYSYGARPDGTKGLSFIHISDDSPAFCHSSGTGFALCAVNRFDLPTQHGVPQCRMESATN